MLREIIVVIEFLAAVGVGLVGGVFFAFSTFVMRGLADLPVAEGIKAMNAINVRAITPVFMALLFGTGVLCLALVIMWGWWQLHHGMVVRERLPVVTTPIGALIYIFGAILVTMIRNVPLNRALAGANDASGQMLWRTFLRDWVKWNHVRTVACIVAFVLLNAQFWAAAIFILSSWDSSELPIRIY